MPMKKITFNALLNHKAPNYKPMQIEVEKVIEVERIVEKVVEVPCIKKVIRVKYLRNPIEFVAVGVAGLIIGIIIGLFL